MSFQALECILKLKKTRRTRIEVPDEQKQEQKGLAGCREDNEWMQYDSKMSDADLESYWRRPFSVKPWLGFGERYPKPLKMRTVDETRVPEGALRDAFEKSFGSSEYVERLLSLNAVEHKKGEDFFSMDKSLFYALLYDAFGDQFHHLLMPMIKEKAASSEESDQRVAAELVFGAVRGSRFWSFERSSKLWSDLVPVLKGAVGDGGTNPECLRDWEACLNAATNKIDPNRIR